MEVALSDAANRWPRPGNGAHPSRWRCGWSPCWLRRVPLPGRARGRGRPGAPLCPLTVPGCRAGRCPGTSHAHRPHPRPLSLIFWPVRHAISWTHWPAHKTSRCTPWPESITDQAHPAPLHGLTCPPHIHATRCDLATNACKCRIKPSGARKIRSNHISHHRP